AIVKDVVFCGKDFKIEIWAKEKFDENGITQDEFVNLAEKILG
ncbi:MAG: division/cell wall cluster transcriptional repressor MraZ, partial [Bacteroidales bacterium]|nr:division/cell wall cluster transcriptional repressor MraZ [Bacteroidales bacterium]